MSEVITTGDEYGILTEPTEIEANDISLRLAKNNAAVADKDEELEAFIAEYRAIYKRKKAGFVYKIQQDQQSLKNFAISKMRKAGVESGTVELPYVQLCTRKLPGKGKYSEELLHQTPDITARLIELEVLKVIPEHREVDLTKAKKALNSGELAKLEIANLVSIERGEPSFSIKFTDIEQMLKRSKLAELPEQKED